MGWDSQIHPKSSWKKRSFPIMRELPRPDEAREHGMQVCAALTRFNHHSIIERRRLWKLRPSLSVKLNPSDFDSNCLTPPFLGKRLSVGISHGAAKTRAAKSLLHAAAAKLAISGIAFKARGRGFNCSVSSNKMKQQQQQKKPPRPHHLFFF